jgi:hypothetical protein
MALRSMRAPARAAPRAAHRTHTASRRLAPPHAAPPPRRSTPQPQPLQRSPRALAALPPWAAALAPSGGASSGSGSNASANANASAPSVIRAFYDAINARDLDAALACIDEECVYEDMIYAAPFEGKAAVAAHFRNVFAALPPDMAFVVRRACVCVCDSLSLSARALTPARACARGRSTT